MTPLPKITVITPSYNQGAYLGQTMASVLGQGYANLEYIVVDGGSTDNSVEIIRSHEKHLAYWVSEKDSGQAQALNKGFAKATGDILCWLNSDDFFLPGVLHEVAQLLGEQDGLIYGDCLSFSERGNRARVNRPPRHDIELLKIVDYVVQPSTFWTRSLWEKTGVLNEELHYAFDWDWFLRASALGNVRKVDRIFSAYRFHDAHKSSHGGDKRAREIVTVAALRGGDSAAQHYQFTLDHAADLRKYEDWVLRLRGRGLQKDHLARWMTPALWKLPAGLDFEKIRECFKMLKL